MPTPSTVASLTYTLGETGMVVARRHLREATGDEWVQWAEIAEIMEARSVWR